MNWHALRQQTTIDGDLVALELDRDGVREQAALCGLECFPTAYLDYFRCFGHGFWGDNEWEFLPPIRIDDEVFSIADFYQQEWPEAAAVDDDFDGPDPSTLIPLCLTGVEDVYLTWRRGDPVDSEGERRIYIVDIVNLKAQVCAEGFVDLLVNQLFGNGLAPSMQAAIKQDWVWEPRFCAYVPE